jgi:hypothetical protein
MHKLEQLLHICNIEKILFRCAHIWVQMRGVRIRSHDTDGLGFKSHGKTFFLIEKCHCHHYTASRIEITHNRPQKCSQIEFPIIFPQLHNKLSAHGWVPIWRKIGKTRIDLRRTSLGKKKNNFLVTKCSLVERNQQLIYLNFGFIAKQPTG